MAARSGRRGADERAWTQKGTAARVDDILAAACELLVQEGYAKFSLRKVAAAVGVGLATVQYHFSNRESLLSAAITKVMKGWAETFAKVSAGEDLSLHERLALIHHQGLRFIDDPQTTPLLVELFAAAQHEPYLREIVRGQYLRYRTMVANVLRAVRPELSDAELMAFGALFVAQMEGLTIFMQQDDPNRPDDALMRRVLRSEIAGFVTAFTAYEPLASAQPSVIADGR